MAVARTDHRARGPRAAFALAVTVAMLVAPGAMAAERAAQAHLGSRHVAQAPAGFSGICTRYSWVCARTGRPARVDDRQLEQARRINRDVNRQVREVADRAQYGIEELWALPTRRGGDCEDFALLKKARLIERGIPPERLLIATVISRKSGKHAVLVLRTDRGDYVLDNLDDRVRHWTDTPYTYLRMQDPEAPHRWTAVLAGGVFRG